MSNPESNDCLALVVWRPARTTSERNTPKLSNEEVTRNPSVALDRNTHTTAQHTHLSFPSSLTSRLLPAPHLLSPNLPHSQTEASRFLPLLAAFLLASHSTPTTSPLLTPHDALLGSRALVPRLVDGANTPQQVNSENTGVSFAEPMGSEEGKWEGGMQRKATISEVGESASTAQRLSSGDIVQPTFTDGALDEANNPVPDPCGSGDERITAHDEPEPTEFDGQGARVNARGTDEKSFHSLQCDTSTYLPSPEPERSTQGDNCIFESTTIQPHQGDRVEEEIQDLKQGPEEPSHVVDDIEQPWMTQQLALVATATDEIIEDHDVTGRTSPAPAVPAGADSEKSGTPICTEVEKTHSGGDGESFEGPQHSAATIGTAGQVTSGRAEKSPPASVMSKSPTCRDGHVSDYDGPTRRSPTPVEQLHSNASDTDALSSADSAAPYAPAQPPVCLGESRKEAEHKVAHRSQETNPSPDIFDSVPASPVSELMVAGAPERANDSVADPVIRENFSEAQRGVLTELAVDIPITATSAVNVPQPLQRGDSDPSTDPVSSRRLPLIKRKKTLDDLFSTMPTVKRKKVELLQRKPVPDETVAIHPETRNLDDSVNTTIPDGRQSPTLSGKELVEELGPSDPVLQHRVETEEQVEPERPSAETERVATKEQWRVGRLPGHQGSHLRKRADISGDDSEKAQMREGQKRSLGQSINDSAERVLKKPFRLPARVVLKTAPRRRQQSPALDTASDITAYASSSPLRGSSPPGSHQDKPSPPSSKQPNFGVPRRSEHTSVGRSTRVGLAASAEVGSPVSAHGSSGTLVASSPLKSSPTYSKRLSKPFKTPFARSAAPSPPSKGSSKTSPLSYILLPSSSKPRKFLLELEKAERALRQALKYHTEPEEDDRLEELITLWQEAGQQVAEMLFAIQPKPDAQGNTGRPSGAAGWAEDNNPFSLYQDDKSFFGASSDLTPEQLRYLARLDVNKDGEPVDDDGNPIFGQGDEAASESYNDRPLQSGQPYSDRYTDQRGMTGSRISASADPEDWNIGTMLSKMGVDPAMYAWDADTEHWARPTS